VGGVHCHEINTLELEFLFSVNFTLHVTSDEFTRYHTELVHHLQALNPPHSLRLAAEAGGVPAHLLEDGSAGAAVPMAAVASGSQGKEGDPEDADVELMGRGQGAGRTLQQVEAQHAAALPVHGATTGAPLAATGVPLAAAGGYGGGYATTMA
ncbi:unnamed protein product, partial [Symbiodinium sp. KB8]